MSWQSLSVSLSRHSYASDVLASIKEVAIDANVNKTSWPKDEDAQASMNRDYAMADATEEFPTGDGASCLS
jgi:hypothetical protein